MNKIITITYSIVGCLIIALTTNVALSLNTYGTSIANFLLLLPMLTISFIVAWLANNKMQKVSISDIIVPACIIYFLAMILAYLPLFFSTLSERPLYGSNILLYTFTYIYVVILLVGKKIPNKKAVKYMKIGGSIVYVFCVIVSVINCFIQVIEYTAG